MSLREALVGMIWEYGRHMGHVDLLRERIDGRQASRGHGRGAPGPLNATRRRSGPGI